MTEKRPTPAQIEPSGDPATVSDLWVFAMERHPSESPGPVRYWDADHGWTFEIARATVYPGSFHIFRDAVAGPPEPSLAPVGLAPDPAGCHWVRLSSAIDRSISDAHRRPDGPHFVSPYRP